MSKSAHHTAKPRATRLYIVRDKEGSPVALLEAQTPAQCLGYMARQSWTAAYAEQTDIIAATKAGLEPVRVERDPESAADE